MTWNDITVLHYQTIYPYIKDESLTDIERDCKILSILTGKSEAQLDRLTWEEFKKLRASIRFLHDGEIKADPVEILRTPKRNFRINYDVRKNAVGRYIEVKHFAADEKNLIPNLHYIMASMVTPLKRGVFGLTVDKYDAALHEQYANEIQGAKFNDVFYSMVFFCNLYANWMNLSKDYLVQNLMKQTKNLTKEQALQLVQTLCSDMDGFITSNKLPLIKGLHLTRLLKYQHWKP